MGKTCCFIGQEECTVTDSMWERLPDILKKLIEYMDVDHFLFGKRSAYMTFCRAAVREAKKEHPQVTMQEYRMPPGAENNGFARERGMIDESCAYIFYYDPKGRALCTLLSGSPARDRTEAAFLYAYYAPGILFNLFEMPFDFYLPGASVLN